MPKRKNCRSLEGKVSIPKHYVEFLERICVRPLLEGCEHRTLSTLLIEAYSLGMKDALEATGMDKEITQWKA